MVYRTVCFLLCTFALAPLTGHTTTALSLAEAQSIAAKEAPQLAAQDAALRAAQQASIGAAERPDPKLIIGLDNLPLDGADRYNVTRDFMTMRKIGFMQDFTRSEKLQLRGERASAEVQKEAAVLQQSAATLQRDVALAWLETYFAERQLAQLKELVNETRLEVTAAQAALAGGKGQAADPFAARISAAQLDDRISDAERQVTKSRANLARWIGDQATRPLDSAPAFEVPDHEHAALLNNFDNLPHLAMYAPLQAIADSEVRLAEAAKHPDWSLEIVYAQRGPTYSNMLSIGVRIDLPIFQSRRQDPAIAAKLALAEQARAVTEDAKRAHVAEIKNLMADWESAKARVQRYQSTLLPLAHERSAVSLAAYRGGKADLIPVIEARKGEIDMRMNLLQAQSELARAWANLHFLLPDAKSKDTP